MLTSAAHTFQIGTIQRRLGWPLRKYDMQIHETFCILKRKGKIMYNNEDNTKIKVIGSCVFKITAKCNLFNPLS